MFTVKHIKTNVAFLRGSVPSDTWAVVEELFDGTERERYFVCDTKAKADRICRLLNEVALIEPA